MTFIETALSEYWMIIFLVLIVLLLALIFIIRFVSMKKKKPKFTKIITQEKESVFNTQESNEEKIITEQPKLEFNDTPVKPVLDSTIETQRPPETKKINTWADFIIELDDMSKILADAKSHEYFKMSQNYRELTRFYFDNIQNPNIEKADMDKAWKKLEDCYSKIQNLLKNI